MTVFLVGAGPGDPGLLTRRGAELLAAADVVVHDRLIEASVLALAGPRARRIDVGKRRGGGPFTQEEINALLVELGRQEVTVVRLKGGDPFVFGRGGEEALALEAAGVGYEVVPGVSSISAVPAAAGIPLTHRGLASSVTVVSGHDPVALAERLARAGPRATDTVVIVMGGAERRAVRESLLAAGWSATTPVAIIEAATTPAQRSVRLALEDLEQPDVGSPATIVVGSTSQLALASYEDRPLFGWRVVVTRAEEQAGELAERLARAGAVPIEMATIAITDPADGGTALAEAAERVAGFSWVVFTSANAVERFFAKLPDARFLADAKVAAVGAATTAALGRHGVVADLVPERFVGEGLVAAFSRPEGSGRVLVPRSANARDVVPDGLRRLGWTVEVVDAYQTVHPAPDPTLLDAVRAADAVTFASSSAVSGFVETAGLDAVPPVVATIGPVTSATARSLGIAVNAEATEHTTLGLLAELIAYAATSARRPL